MVMIFFFVKTLKYLKVEEVKGEGRMEGEITATVFTHQVTNGTHPMSELSNKYL